MPWPQGIRWTLTLELDDDKFGVKALSRHEGERQYAMHHVPGRHNITVTLNLWQCHPSLATATLEPGTVL